MPHTELPTSEKAESWEEKQNQKITILQQELTALYDGANYELDFKRLSPAIGELHDLQHKAYYLKRALIELRNWKKNH